MDMSELQAKLRKRQIASGQAPDEPVKKKEPTKIEIPSKDKSAMEEIKRNLEGIYGNKQGGGSSVPETKIEKEEIKGNPDSFNEAKRKLQGKLDGNKNKGSSLPPPPPPPPGMGNLPPPPPPPLKNIPLPPPLGSSLPPPPKTNLLPPPPPLNLNKPTESKSVNTQPPKLQPPPPLVQKPVINIQSPPIQQNPVIHVQAPNLQPPPPLPQKPVVNTVEKQQVRKPSEEIKTKVQQTQPRRQHKIFDKPVEKSSEVTVKVEPIKQEKTSSKKPSETENKQGRRETKKKIFDRSSSKAQPVTSEFFQKDLAALIKRQFIRENDILGVIGTKVQKRLYSFNFPSIENKHREVEGIETLYADVANLDLVSCYMQRNMNAIKPHSQAREQFLAQLEKYNWTTDPMRLKPIREAAQNVPSDIHYRELNLVQVKNCLNKCDSMIKAYIKMENFQACTDMKNLRQETSRLVQNYCKQPEKHAQTYEQIEKNLIRIKQTQ